MLTRGGALWLAAAAGLLGCAEPPDDDDSAWDDDDSTPDEPALQFTRPIRGYCLPDGNDKWDPPSVTFDAVVSHPTDGELVTAVRGELSETGYPGLDRAFDFILASSSDLNGIHRGSWIRQLYSDDLAKQWLECGSIAKSARLTVTAEAEGFETITTSSLEWR